MLRISLILPKLIKSDTKHPLQNYELKLKDPQKKLGLYVHIPFCSFMCHYCDFAKTANWSDALLSEYLDKVLKHLDLWLQEFVTKRNYEIDTLFLGGGTPGILSKEYEELFQLLTKYKIVPEEATLEVNPENISEEHLKTWKDVGFNRLSIGVQSFQDKGLHKLTRQHNSKDILSSLDLACSVFENISCDLIYGWEGQRLEDWEKDLDQFFQYPLKHLSTYCLTIEPRTPFGRMHKRGKLKVLEEESFEDYYILLRDTLKAKKWDHYECSNASLPGFHSRHNRKYWVDDYFLGIGTGAWGYIPGPSIGERYFYSRQERSFTRESLEGLESYKTLPHCTFEERSTQDWLFEYVGCGLRQKEGISLKKIEQIAKLRFEAKSSLRKAIEEEKVLLKADRLYLAPEEWIRETQWCLEVLESFMP